MVLISTSTAPALCPCAVLVRYWANGQSGFKKGREGVYLEIERCLARPQETAISEGQPPSTPPSSLEREEMWILEAATSHARFPHAHTCTDHSPHHPALQLVDGSPPCRCSSPCVCR